MYHWSPTMIHEAALSNDPITSFSDHPSAMKGVALAHEDGDLTHISLDLISIDEVHNPRTYFEDEALRALVASVRENGIIQPITVRPHPTAEGEYMLVAGERRFRAAKSAGLEDIPAIVRLVDADQAHVIATIENTIRDDMSPAEEAKAARKVLTLCDNDREEALRRLGWSRTKLDARLALLHANQDVLKALAERKIKLGHAELLAAIPEHMQTGTLNKVIEVNVSVADLRAKIDAFAYRLEKAVFDTSGCNGCPNNTSEQASLFGSSIGEGRCTNPVCWAQKESEHMDGLKADLATKYPVIWMDKESTPESRRIVLRDDVGRDQAIACRGCAHYGALLSTQPGKMGEVTEGVCFNTSCHAEKVAVYKAELKAAIPVTSAGQPIIASIATPATATASTAPKRGVTKATASTTPKKVLELVEAEHRKIAAAEVSADSRMVRLFAITAMLTDASNRTLDGGKDEYERVLAAHGLKNNGTGAQLSGSYRAALLARLHALDDSALENIARAAAAALAGAKGEAHLPNNGQTQTNRAAIKLIKADIGKYFTLDKVFLEAHTKGGIGALMVEAGFDKWLDEKNGKGEFKKVMGGKNAEIIDAILNSGFDFKNFVPSTLKVA